MLYKLNIMSESKTVSINLKQLIADLVFAFAFADKDEDNINDVKSKFEEVYILQNISMQSNIINYLLNNKVVQDNKKLIDYFNTFSK